MTKLTLSVDEEVVAEAKRIAAENNTSVSAMFSEYIRAMAREKWKDVPIGPLTRAATGLIELPEGKTYEDVLTEALMEKYGIE